MLRVLMMLVIAASALFTLTCWAEESLNWNETLQRLDRQPVQPGTAMPDMTAILQAGQQQHANSVIEKLLSSPDSPMNTGTVAGGNDHNLVPLVFVSFSMPESALKQLLVDAHKVGAQLVLNGLVADDLKKTAEKISQLTDAGNSNADGFGIDPTLFERFGIQQVPVFILPLEPVQACTQDAGCPTPPNIRISGDVSLGYALDKLIPELTDAGLQGEVQAWVKTLQGNQP